jgi:ribosomal protein S18 acetylase RimI-like enzyme
MTDDVHLRHATEADHPALLALNRAVQALHAEARPDLFRPAAEVALGPEELRAWLARPGVVVWLACRGGEVLGYLYAERQARPQDAYRRAQEVFYVHQLAVRPDARRRGLATPIVRHAIAHARGEGISRVELDFWSFNAGARRLYERLGFAPLIERVALELRGSAHEA